MSQGKPDSSRRAVAFFRWLLRFYPAAFRREYEEKLILLFQDQLRDAKARKTTGAMVRFWVRMLADTGYSASRERWSDLRRMLASELPATLLHCVPPTPGRRIRMVFLSCILVSLGVWCFTPVTYLSAARIMLRTKDGSFDSGVIATAVGRVSEQQTLESVYGLLRSGIDKRDLKTLLEQHSPFVYLPEINIYGKGTAASAVARVRRHLRVVQYRDTSVIEIRFTAARPEEAAAMANLIASAFMDRWRELGGQPFEIIDPAIPSSRPIAPNLPASIIFAVIYGLGGSGILELLLFQARRSSRFIPAS